MGKFKFKSFAERVNDVDIDVFRRFDVIKLEPRSGSSFFHESLLQWRELNAAREFVDAYEELLPLAETLPQLLLHKKTIVHRLLSCLQPEAALSLEPIISLTAILSRDLSQDFVELIPEIFSGLLKLLQLGGDRDSTILEMVFTNVAYIFKYMLKFLTKDIVFVLKVTKKFRFYPQDYVRAFAAEAISFVLRNAPLTQIIKGVRKAVSEADHGPVEASACSSLLTFTLKGPSGGFHSRAEELLKVLFDSSALRGMWEQKGDVVVTILKQVLSELVEEIQPGKLDLLWSCLLEEIPPELSKVENGSEETMIQAKRLLTLTNHLLEQRKVPAMADNKLLNHLALRVLKLVPKLADELVLMFLLNCLRKRAGANIQMPAVAPLWDSAFENAPLSSTLPFVEKLVEQQTELVSPFIPLLLRGLEQSFETYPGRCLRALQKLFESHGVEHVENPNLARAVSCSIETSLAKLKDGDTKQSLEELELVWRALRCFPHIAAPGSQSSVCLEHAALIDQHLSSATSLSEQDSEVWMALLGASLLAHAEAAAEKPGIASYLNYGLKYPSSFSVLDAVAYCSSLRIVEEGSSSPPELDHQSLLRDCKALQKNLGDSNRKLRVATLKLLKSYEQTELSSQIIDNLLDIEAMLLEAEKSPRIASTILRIKNRSKSGELAGLVFYAMLGVLQNRVTTSWEPAIDCLHKSFDEFSDAVPAFVSFLSSSLARSLAEKQAQDPGFNDFWGTLLHDTEFSTPPGSLVASLLRSLQKVSSKFVSQSGELVSMFLSFVEHKSGSESPMNGKDWSSVLRHWLQLLSQLKISSVPGGDVLKEVLIDRFLVVKDQDIQKKALECVLLWKDPALTTYKEHLLNIISKDDLREELTLWNPSEQVADEHREKLVPVLLRVLHPKLSKKNAKRGKPTRSFVLSFVNHLEARELRTLFLLIFRPLEAAFRDESWTRALEDCETRKFIEFVDGRRIEQLPFKRKNGFLQLAKDLIETLDGEHIEPFIHAIMAFIIRFLESAALDPEKDTVQKNEGKDLRATCLKLLSSLLQNFQNVEFSSEYSDVLFGAVKHSIRALVEENCHNDRPSALLCFFLKLSEDESSAELLLRDELLVPNVFSLFHSESLSAPVHSAALSFVENLLAMRHETMELVLVPHLRLLLEGILKQLNRKMPKSKMDRSKSYLKQHLKILSRLSIFIDDSSRASEFLDIMLLFLNTKERVDPEIRVEVLKILRELSGLFDEANVSKCVQAFGPLLSSISAQEARTILCQCLEKLSIINSSLSSVAEILVDLNSMSTSRIEECDYDRRQAAYGKMDHIFFSKLQPPQASLVLSQLVFDLEAEDMRYNAASSLIILVRAAGEGSLEEKVRDLVYEFLLSRITRAMKSESSAIRREWILIFRELVNRSSSPAFLEFKCLTSPDPETDFFNNIIHVQLHRRIKAMAKFRGSCESSAFSQRSLSKLFVPLFLHSLFEERAKDGNLNDATIETIGCVSARLSWAPAVKLVIRLFHLIRRRSEHQKLLVRLVCLLLDKSQASWSEKLSKETGDGDGDGDGGRIIPASMLEEKVLPHLDKLMLTDESVNVPVALASVKVLQLMPEEVMTKNFPRICQTITNLLKSRSQEIRDEARAAIVGMVEILGSSYLGFVVRMLQASLKRGYEKHVLGFTVNSILIRVVPQLEAGSLDYCVEDLMRILEEEMFGEVSEEKEVEALARKMKERKQARGFDSLRLVARVVSFRDQIGRLLRAAREQSASSSSSREKLQLFLRSVSSGIQENPSASEELVLGFVKELLHEFLAEDSSSNLELLAEFWLMVLSSRLKNKQPSSEELLVLDGLLRPLQRCLASKHDGVVSGALKCLSLLLRLQLPSIPELGEAVVKGVFARARVCSSSDSPLMQACMKLISVLLRHCKGVSLSEAEAHELLQFNIFVDIENQNSQALALLKAVVERKVLVPELYDLIDRVQKLMVTSQLPVIRQRCSQIMLQFLLDYPLGTKRLQHHFNFLLANLSYEHVSGREAAVEMLHTVIVKFPDAVIEEQSNGLFLTLMARLGSEKDGSVQILLETLLKVLMKRVGSSSLEQMREFLLSWMSGEKKNLWLPATQGTRLLAEAMEQGFDRYFDSFWPAVMRILGEARALSWKTSYNVLLLIEKLFRLFSGRVKSSCSEETWEVIQEFLLHKQISVRKVATRLTSIYAGSLSRKQTSSRHKALMLAAILCEQMISPVFDDELGDGVAQSLTMVAGILFPASFPSEDLNNDGVVKALLMLKGKKQNEMSIDHLRKLMGKDDFSVLVLIIQRLSRVTLEETQGKIVLRWYSSVLRQLQKQGSVEALLPYILHSLFKVERSTAQADLKTCAEEVRGEIRELVGAEKFAAAHNNVWQEIKLRREGRKRAQSVAALVDPEGRAKKKIKLGHKRLAQKKRKRSER